MIHAWACRFDLQNWTHILVYSVANGAEQSTPAASRIEDVSSSISALRFVDKAWLRLLSGTELERVGYCTTGSFCVMGRNSKADIKIGLATKNLKVK